jgi:DNA invertase Pin-like site-specific DNA recombinase
VLDTTGDFAELVLAILGVAAKPERRRIAERTAPARADAKANLLTHYPQLSGKGT